MKNTSLTTNLIQQNKGDVSQMSIEHIATAAMLNACYLQLCRFEITNSKQLTQNFKHQFKGLKFAMERCLKFLKLEDKQWKNTQKLTEEEVETVQDNIILASAPINKFCRIASQTSSENYETLTKIVDEVEAAILEAIPEAHKEAFINALKGA